MTTMLLLELPRHYETLTTSYNNPERLELVHSLQPSMPMFQLKYATLLSFNQAQAQQLEESVDAREGRTLLLTPIENKRK